MDSGGSLLRRRPAARANGASRFGRRGCPGRSRTPRTVPASETLSRDRAGRLALAARPPPPEGRAPATSMAPVCHAANRAVVATSRVTASAPTDSATSGRRHTCSGASRSTLPPSQRHAEHGANARRRPAPTTAPATAPDHPYRHEPLPPVQRPDQAKRAVGADDRAVSENRHEP